MDKEHRIEKLLKAISKDKKYRGRVFCGPGIYFVIVNGSLREISDDAGCTPRGGWFPDIVSGPSKEEDACLQKMMEELGFDEDFFKELIFDCDEYDDETAIEYFEDNEDEESLKIYRKMKKKIESEKTPFSSMEDFVSAVGRYGLESDCLYYEWEGEFIDFYDNICETGECRGSYDSLDDGEWMELLENIDEYIVRG